MTMIEDQKKENSNLEKLNVRQTRVERRTEWLDLRFNIIRERVVQIAGGVIQIIMGISVVTLSLIGLIQPGWVATLLSILGSAATVSGAGMLYYALTRRDAFQSLLNRAIRRAIESQN